MKDLVRTRAISGFFATEGVGFEPTVPFDTPVYKTESWPSAGLLFGLFPESWASNGPYWLLTLRGDN